MSPLAGFHGRYGAALKLNGLFVRVALVPQAWHRIRQRFAALIERLRNLAGLELVEYLQDP